ncbi:hypothetical protein Tco_1218616 [Tanacetum coccineum]
MRLDNLQRLEDEEKAKQIFLKNQGTWKIKQLKKLSFDELKEKFDKFVKQVETFVPMNLEAIKAELKRFGEELQAKTAKRQKVEEKKVDETEKVEAAQKRSKMRKQMERKGLHKTDEDESDKDEDKSEKDEASKKAESTSGTEVPINPIPVATKPPSIATYKIIKQGKKDDLTELYRIVMHKHGLNGPEDALEKVLWEYLKNMFDTPLSTDSVWSLPGQQKIISWRYYPVCRVHCLCLESTDIYMLTERRYPLSAQVYKTMLDKKLQGMKTIKDCYKLLKMIEKQAGIYKP